MNTETERNVRYACNQCNGTRIQADATARWDENTQKWVVTDVLHVYYCDDCGGITGGVHEEPIPTDLEIMLIALKAAYAEMLQRGATVDDPTTAKVWAAIQVGEGNL